MDGLSARTREREIQRQLMYNRVRKAVLTRVPAIVREYLSMLSATTLGLAVIVWVLHRFAHLEPVYVLAALGLMYSSQLAYYKVMLARDPEFTIPRCKCAGSAGDKSDAVLRSKEGGILGVPNVVLAIGFYVALIALVASDQHSAAVAVAVAAVLASAYAGYVMVVRIGALCSNCVSIAAVNVLVLLYVVV